MCLTFVVACNYNTQKKEPLLKSKNASVFKYNPSSTVFSWTAYKFIEKVSVTGEIDSVVISNTKPSSKPVDVFKNASFVIYPKTTNSKNAIRDKKIVDYFFGNTKNPNEITGFVKKINQDSSVVSLVFNGIEKDLFANIYSRGTNVFLDCDINVLDWDAIFSLNEINNACELEHKGEGVKSVLWPDVKIRVSSVLTKNIVSVKGAETHKIN